MMKNTANRIKAAYIFAVTIFCMAAFSVANVAFAGTGLTIQPVKVSHTINPGEEVSGIISLKNASDSGEVQVEAKVEDFTPVAGGSTVQFIGRAQGVTTVRDWITLDSEPTFTFDGEDSRAIRYTIKAPKDAEPGGHYGVVFFRAQKYGEGEQLKVGTQVGILVLITIPGNHLQKGKILDFQAPHFSQTGPIPFTIKFENTGTVHFEPKGAITIKNIFGKTVADIPVSGQVVLPTGVRDLKAEWNTAGLLLGKYIATIALVDGDGEQITTKSISFYVIPVWYMVEFFIGLIFAYLAIRYVRRKVKINISLND